MKLYLDDDSVKKSLLALLAKNGFASIIPAEVGLVGRPDPVHLLHSLSHSLALLTRNYRDYPDLHDLVLGSGGHHSGIILVREDNDPKRDMSDRQLVAALGNLVRLKPSLGDQIVILNQWR